MPRSKIHAAGGVVWRSSNREVEVAVVHRPRYDDWSLPKGKLTDSEYPLFGAVREVHEEIGAQVGVSRRLGRVEYAVEAERKLVDYWTMRHLDGAFEPSSEVDVVEWLTPAKARKRLDYPTDRSILADFAALPVPDSVVVLVRHARAGKRSEWRGDDALRPLDPSGEAQAQALVPFLECFAPTRIVSADRNRCVQTLEPFSSSAAVPLEIDPTFSDDSYEQSPAGSRTALYALAKPGQVTVVCSQGLTIPSLI
ncbi:MAG TPA: NUDIX hydrolase, partial [Jatrophihabitantaceae bacterium]|nr:NUDIX hydrolase [Jatrophihabitantaceae bacterium]